MSKESEIENTLRMLDKEVLIVFNSIIKECLYGSIKLTFGHHFSHIISGLEIIRKFELNLNPTMRRNLQIAWIIHDLGRDSANSNNQKEHAIKSTSIGARMLENTSLTEEDKLSILRSVKIHESYSGEKDLKLQDAYMIIIDHIALKDYPNDHFSVLDRAILTKIEEAMMDDIEERKPKVDGYGQSGSGATNQLNSKLIRNREQLKAIALIYPETKSLTEVAIENLNACQFYYFKKIGKIIYITGKLLVNFKFIIDMCKVFLIYKNLGAVLFALVIKIDFMKQKTLINILTKSELNSAKLVNHELLIDNKFNNNSFKFIVNLAFKS